MVSGWLGLIELAHEDLIQKRSGRRRVTLLFKSAGLLLGKDRLMRIQLLLSHGAKTLKLKMVLAWDAIGEGPALSGLVSCSYGFGCGITRQQRFGHHQ